MVPDVLFRPVRETDYESVQSLVSRIPGGLTSLPNHPDYLKERINDSLRAFDHRVSKPAGEVYLFVLEDVQQKILVGTSGLLSRVGGFDPFYTYRIREQLKHYAPLGIQKTNQLLELVKNHKGPSEICSLFLHEKYRRHGIGKLLSQARFCFMKAFPQRFDKEIIAELRGYLDENGYSPFWEAVGRNFFWQDYYQADVLSGIGEKQFIEALMPEFPIYIKLLPPEAQAIIGSVHPQTEPARRILLQEGFHETDEVDIFDAGPILKATRDELRSWKRCETRQIETGGDGFDPRKRFLITNNRLDFRATFAQAALPPGGPVSISRRTADLLEVGEGDTVQVLEME